ncbi:MAG: hypothetical protein ABUL60_03555 [Myxococcales bacterium]
MLWLGGFLALEIATSTPDALCPPLEEAESAIKARVGEVEGDYHAEFALVRASDGRQVLELSLREGSKLVLERELPLTGMGCQDAAQAIALVLERYFDAVEKPEPTESNPEPIPVRPIDQPLAKPVASASHEIPKAAPSAAAARVWEARLGFGYDAELGLAPTLGVALFPVAWRWGKRFEIGVALDVAPFLMPLTQTVREQEISASTLQTAMSLPVRWRFEPWSLALGPWAQLRLQRAEATSLMNAQPAYRLVAGGGLVAQISWSPAPAWLLGCGVAAGAQAAGASSRFTLRRAESGPKPVLVPETWFGQGQLILGRDL